MANTSDNQARVGRGRSVVGGMTAVPGETVGYDQEVRETTTRNVSQVMNLPTDRVRWGPIWAGLLAAFFALLVLSLVGVAIGATTVNAGAAAQGNANANSGAGAFSAIWAGITAILSFLIGGYIAGRTAAVHERGWAALNGDPVSVKLITRSAVLVGETLARLVNFYNPALILIGGGVADVGDLYLATIRQAILRRSLPLATRALRIERSPLGNTAGLTGAGFMVIDQLLTPERLGMWIERGTPAGQPALSA